jgi:tRNA (guanine6-N2)-methyltransferase
MSASFVQAAAVRATCTNIELAGGECFVLTTNAGLEPIVVSELMRRARNSGIVPPVEERDVHVRPWGCFGRVLICRPAVSLDPAVVGGASGSGRMCDPPLEQILLDLRTVHDVMWHHCMLSVPSEAAEPAIALYERVRHHANPAPPMRGGGRSFRVSCVREGDHRFTSLDIEREVGGALQERYGSEARMTGFDLRVRVDVAKDLVLIGTAIHIHPLSKRHKLAFTRSVTLKPNVAVTPPACAAHATRALQPEPPATPAAPNVPLRATRRRARRLSRSTLHLHSPLIAALAALPTARPALARWLHSHL